MVGQLSDEMDMWKYAQNKSDLPGVADIWANMQRFMWQDYVMFVTMLLLCVLIGLYFGVYRASASAQEYLMGGRKMKMFPVSMSLIASFVSGISILGIPTETYLYGMQYMYILGGAVLQAILMNLIYLPVLYNLKLTSIYEYHERRFDRRVRILASVLFTINIFTWLPIVIYMPALAFNQVMGVNVHIITPVICLICIFYTSLGGLKAVVWTDVFQALIMFGAMLLVAVKGTLNAGGWTFVWNKNVESGRIEPPDLDLSLLSRHTIWSLVIGGSLYLLQVSSVNQNMIQRYLSLPTLKKAKRAVWVFVLGLFFVTFVCGYSGLLMYATYHECDPLTTRLARQNDQLLPLFVIETLSDYPGLPGIFVAGVLSAALSSLSTGLNSMAAVIFEDFYKVLVYKPITEKHASVVMKLSVVILGAISVGLVYVIEKLGSVLQLAMSIGTIGSGPSLGLFTMGMLIPWINAKGALIGGLSALVFMSWLVISAQAAVTSGDLLFLEKPVSTDGCNYRFTPKKTFSNASGVLGEENFAFYHLSYLWYTLIGASVTILVGFFTSLLTKLQDPRDVDPELLAPSIRRFIEPRKSLDERDGIIYAFSTTTKV